VPVDLPPSTRTLSSCRAFIPLCTSPPKMSVLRRDLYMTAKLLGAALSLRLWITTTLPILVLFRRESAHSFDCFDFYFFPISGCGFFDRSSPRTSGLNSSRLIVPQITIFFFQSTESSDILPALTLPPPPPAPPPPPPPSALPVVLQTLLQSRHRSAP